MSCIGTTVPEFQGSRHIHRSGAADRKSTDASADAGGKVDASGGDSASGEIVCTGSARPNVEGVQADDGGSALVDRPALGGTAKIANCHSGGRHGAAGQSISPVAVCTNDQGAIGDGIGAAVLRKRTVVVNATRIEPHILRVSAAGEGEVHVGVEGVIPKSTKGVGEIEVRGSDIEGAGSPV